MQETKEAQAQIGVGSILGIVMTIVVTVIGAAFGLQIAGEIQDDMTANSAEANATGEGITAVGNLMEKLPTIATVLAAAIILGILVTYLWVRYN